MFNSSFVDPVIQQLTLRRLYNGNGMQWMISPRGGTSDIRSALLSESNINEEDEQYLRNWAKQWTTRYPFVYAYSNTRFYNTSSMTYEPAWKQYGVLSSTFRIFDSRDEIIPKSTMNIYDFYQRSDKLSGITPKPMIQEFSIQKRATNGTLRTLKCKIVCFSYQQFIGIRDYFAIPGTSIYFQYGYSTTAAINNIKTPHFSQQIEGVELPDADKTVNSYLDKPNSDIKLIKDGHCAIQYSTGIVSGYEITQDGNTYTINLQLITQGTSQLLAYIKNSLPENTGELPQNQTTRKPISSDIISLIEQPIWDNEVISIDRNDNSSCKYVTFNWIINVLFQQIRIRSNLKKKGDKWATSIYPGNPMVKFQSPMYLPIGLRSQDTDILILDQNLDIRNINNGYFNSIYVDNYDLALSAIQNTYTSDICMAAISTQTSIVDFDTSQKLDASAPGSIAYNINKFKEHYLPDQAPPKPSGVDEKSSLVFLGNIYINHKILLNYLQQSTSLSIMGLLNYLLPKISAATGIQLQSISEELGGSIIIYQRSLFYTDPKDFFRIENYGNNSIVKTANFTVKIPDSVKVISMATYNEARTADQDNTITNIFSALFGKDRSSRLIDLHQYRINNLSQDYLRGRNAHLQVVTLPTNEIPPEDSRKKKYQEIEWYKDGKLNVRDLNKQNHKTAIYNHNSALYKQVREQIYALNTVTMYDYSMYSITVQIVLDFIGGFSWGQMFKLAFNPLGWQAAFVVIGADHTFNDKGAQTKLTGLMLGVSAVK